MTRFRRPSLATLTTVGFFVLALGWGAILASAQISGARSFLDRIEYLTLDWRFLIVGPQPPPRGVTVVAIDDETIQKSGGYPLPRSAIAEIVRRIAALDPQALVVDIAFLDARKDDPDSGLADALKSTTTVLPAVGLFAADDVPLSQDLPADFDLIPTPSKILWPIATLGLVRTGLANISTDQEGVPRFAPMVYRSEGKFVPSFALASAAAALNAEPVFGAGEVALAGRTLRTDLGYHLALRYYGPHGGFRQISAARFLDGGVDPNAVRKLIVLVGVTAVAAGDIYPTPFDRVTPGVEILATAVSNLLAGDNLVRTRLVRRIDAAAMCLLPCLTVLFLAMRQAYKGMALAALLNVAWLGLTILAFAEGYWLDVAGPLAAVAPIAVAYGAARLSIDRFVANRLAADKVALSSFRSTLLDHVLKTPSFLEKPIEQPIAVVFIDLSGFTGLSELVGPKWTRDLLASLQSLIGREATSYDGHVVNFMGDGAMVVFGLPAPRESDASRALLAIFSLRKSISEWLETLPLVARTRLGVRIGGHYGPAVVSRLGADDQQQITAIGDTVNVASRLLEAAKELKCAIVVSEDLVEATNLTDLPERGLDSDTQEIGVRGRAQTIRVRIAQ
jgi:adenylate cyclase